MKPTYRLNGLYLITPEIDDTALLIEKVSTALTSGAHLVQYRNKSASTTKKQQQAIALRELCDLHNALLIINDDALLAKFCRADGVHLGQSDGSILVARDLLGDNGIIGVTCHSSLLLAKEAATCGVDYLSFGRFFPSRTKPHAPAADLSILTQAKQQFTLPICAIGGISFDNAPQVTAAGADMLAMCGSIFE
jgi:thiamine-phosphate pyrophosphorylase